MGVSIHDKKSYMHGKNTQKQKNANSSYANKENNIWLSRNNLLFNLRISLFHQDILGTMSARVRWKGERGGGTFRVSFYGY